MPSDTFWLVACTSSSHYAARIIGMQSHDYRSENSPGMLGATFSSAVWVLSMFWHFSVRYVTCVAWAIFRSGEDFNQHPPKGRRMHQNVGIHLVGHGAMAVAGVDVCPDFSGLGAVP